MPFIEMLQSGDVIDISGVQAQETSDLPSVDITPPAIQHESSEPLSSPHGESHGRQSLSNGDDDPGYVTITSAEIDGAKSKKAYQCSFCEKRYERLDHVKRHINSHENTRPFKCRLCARRFNRRDLLVRHQVVHEPDLDPAAGRTKRAERVIQACQGCTAAKTKCDDRRPCRRCDRRRVPCVDSGPTRRAALLTTAGIFEQARPGPNTASVSYGDTNDQLDVMEVEADGTDEVIQSEPMPLGDTQMPQTQNPIQHDLNVSNWASDFGNAHHEGIIDDPFWDNLGWENMNFQADLAHIYQDMDFTFNDELPSIHSESWPTFDLGLSNLNTNDTTNGEGHDQARTAGNQSGLRSEHVVSGHEAFKKSPWLWTPSKQDHAYSGHSQLAVDEANIMTSPEVIDSTHTVSRPLPRILDPGTRDEMLPMVINFSKSALKIRSFPSYNLLNVLMQAFFVRDGASIDSWIHVPTFEPDKCRTELLAGLVSAGSTQFAIPNIWKMGLALQDVVKLAICDALDNDNRLARDLQTNQAFLIWIEVGLWSGFRRKMEVAEGFAHTVPTMLRRAGAFRQSHYSRTPYPEIVNEGEILRQKWVQWAELESHKRLVFRVFINEMRSSIAFVRNPVFSGMELTLTLPAARDLWEASSPEEWKRLYLAKPHPATSLTLIDGLHNPSLLEEDASIIDLPMSAHAILYALWAKVWTLSDAKTFHQHGSTSSRRATTQLWLEAQHQELYNNVKDIKEKLDRLRVLSSEAHVLCELLMMSLHASLEDIQSFAGRFGEREMKHALPQLRDWAHRNDYYVATWHAGQVLRAARLLPPTSLQGFLAIAVYHASLLLWVAAWLSRRSQEPSRASPTAETTGRVQFDLVNSGLQHQGRMSQNLVILDGVENAQTRAYLTAEKGRPALQLAGKASEIGSPATIPAVMTEIFRQNYPSRTHPLPPLLENLASLMEELSHTQQLG